jgi:hypothetical protein
MSRISSEIQDLKLSWLLKALKLTWVKTRIQMDINAISVGTVGTEQSGRRQLYQND